MQNLQILLLLIYKTYAQNLIKDIDLNQRDNNSDFEQDFEIYISEEEDDSSKLNERSDFIYCILCSFLTFVAFVCVIYMAVKIFKQYIYFGQISSLALILIMFQNLTLCNYDQYARHYYSLTFQRNNWNFYTPTIFKYCYILELEIFTYYVLRYKHWFFSLYSILYVLLCLCLPFINFIIQSGLINFYYNYYYQFSFLLPLLAQIVSNMRLNQNGIYEFYYIFPLSLQCFQIMYYRGCPENVNQMEANYLFTISFFIAFIILLIFLKLQHKLGPLFFRGQIQRPHPPPQPKRKYNFKKKVMLADDDENCPICLCPLIEEPDNDANQRKKHLLKKLMVPPCNHKFHVQCMTDWLEVSDKCPVCRANFDY